MRDGQDGATNPNLQSGSIGTGNQRRESLQIKTRPGSGGPARKSQPAGGRKRITERLTVQACTMGERGEGICNIAPAHPQTSDRRAEEHSLQGTDLGTGPNSWSGARGLRLHVVGLLPGETAQIELEHVSPHSSESFPSRSAWGRILQRENSSPERVQPACAGYGKCGGCTLQHLCYPAQLKWKQEQLANALKLLPFWNMARESVVLPTCVPSPDPLGYRSRVKLVAAAQKDGRVILGAYAPRSHEVVDMAGCKVNLPSLTLLADSSAKAATELGLSCFDEAGGSGILRYVLLRETSTGVQQLSLVVADLPTDAQLAAFVKLLKKSHPNLASIVLHRNTARGNALLGSPLSSGGAASSGGAEGGELGTADDDRVLLGEAHVWEQMETPELDLQAKTRAASGARLRVSARSFLQVNRAIASRIYAAAAALVPAGSQVLDLYCGVGGLGLTVLGQVPSARLLGIETSASAIADAVAGAQAAGFGPDRARFLCGAVELLLPEVQDVDPAGVRANSHEVALLNPPRRGCFPAVLQALLTRKPARIIYVSCNPTSLARDLDVLCSAGYSLRQATPYDMHPGTPHIETLAVLDRVGS